MSVSQYEMYEKQLLSTTLETMSDIELCPRINCQCPTIVDRDRSMGHCPNCEYAFCIYCRCAYHGVNACRYVLALCDPIRYLRKAFFYPQETNCNKKPSIILGLIQKKNASYLKIICQATKINELN